MAENETRVTYKAIADFVSFTRAVDRAKQKLQELRKEEAALNAESAAGSAAATAASGRHAGAMSDESSALERVAAATDRAAVAQGRHSSAISDTARESRSAAAEAENLAGSTERGATAAVRSESAFTRFVRSVSRVAPAFRAGNGEMSNTSRVANTLRGNLSRLQRNLDKLRDWRPRLMPPFIALIPVIASLLALINPLIAGIGAVVPVALGFASSLGSVAAAAIGAVPALAGLLATVLSLKTAFSGIGGAFQKYAAAQSAGGGGGSGSADKQIELTQTEKITRAQEDYARAVQDVGFAEDDLDSARKDYIKRVNDLRKAVDRAAASEAAAKANVQLANENYANVLADPGSTKGQKMDASSQVTDAQNNLTDVQDQNKENAEDLAALQKTGIEGDRQVIMAQRGVTDALRAQRDAQIDLQNAIKGTSTSGGAAATATAAYQSALDKLSPSARRFVLELIGMKDAFDTMKRTVQEAFFSQFIGDLQSLRKLFGPVTSMMSDIAAAAGRVADNFLKMVTSDSWLADFQTFGKEFAPILEDVGNGLLNIIDGLRNVAIAALPFLGDAGKNFLAFTQNLRDMLASARNDGSLAAYLQKVEGRLRTWWSIIKNVGKTIFNYSAAASDFGDWLTNGFLKLTENWVKNSEDARKKGSGFQQYLEDLKPLLKQVKGLFGDFFGYLHDEATDPDNIKMFTNLVKIIREDVGPALKRILDALSKSGIQNSLAKAVGALLDAIATFLENGGADGLKAFFDVLTGIFKVVGKIIKLIPKPVLEAFVGVMAGLAALTFIGINALIGNLLRLGASRGLSSLFKLMQKVFPALAEFVGGTAFKSLLKGLGKGGLVGAAVGIGSGIGADAIRNANKGPAGDSGSGARVGANILDGAGTGAGIGATVGSVIPGVGTVVGGAIGGAIGGGVGLATSDDKDKARFFSDTKGMFSDFFTKNLPKWWDDNFGVGWRQIEGWWKDVIGDFRDGWKQISDWWDDVIGDFRDGWKQISDWWNGVIGGISDTWNGFIGWLNDVWQGVIDWWNSILQWFSDTWAGVTKTANDIWVNIQAWWASVTATASAVWVAVSDWWSGVVDYASRIWGNIQSWWSGIVDYASRIWTNVQNWWSGVVDYASRIWGKVQDWWSDVTSYWSAIGDVFQTNWNDVIDFWSRIGSTVQRLWKSAIGGITDFFSGKWSTGGSVSGHTRHYATGGGVQGFATGGDAGDGGGNVPGHGNGDSVPALLTPGEFVIRKAIVARVGVENLQRLNSGVLSFAQMLKNAAGGQGGASGVGTGSTAGISMFAGGGIVPSFSGNTGTLSSVMQQTPTIVSNDYSMHFGDIIINNPVAERSSDSLPNSIRKAGYLGALRKGSDA